MTGSSIEQGRGLAGDMAARLVGGIRRLPGHALDFVLPPRCPACAVIVGSAHTFCASCWARLDFITGQGCAHCGVPLSLGDEMICAPCLAQPPGFDHVTAAVAYGEIARDVALRLKYGRQIGLAKTIANILAPRIQVAPGTIVMPVPLHRWRLWARGYNQALLIARRVAAARGLTLDAETLVRSRRTQILRGLNPAERRRTVAGAFVVTRALKGASILLIDDVFTTGATVDACARALKRAGAAQVMVACWARVLRAD